MSVKGITFNAAVTGSFGLPNFDSSNLQISSWAVIAKHEIGAHRLRAAYARNQKVEVAGQGIPDSKASYWSVGYGYALSKRTEVFGRYTQIRNEANSANNFSVSNIEFGNAGVGADPRSIGVGIRHTF